MGLIASPFAALASPASMNAAIGMSVKQTAGSCPYTVRLPLRIDQVAHSRPSRMALRKRKRGVTTASSTTPRPPVFGGEIYVSFIEIKLSKKVNEEPLAKFIERGEFSLCSRGGGAGAQAGAGLSCVTRSI